MYNVYQDGMLKGSYTQKKEADKCLTEVARLHRTARTGNAAVLDMQLYAWGSVYGLRAYRLLHKGRYIGSAWITQAEKEV